MKIARIVKSMLVKRTGLVIYRPILNAQAWSTWLTECGLPNAVAAADMRCNVLQATGDVSVIPDNTPDYVASTDGVFVGTSDGGMAFVWYDWGYYDRQWALQSLGGADVSCTASRSMVMLSPNVADFEFTDAMLLRAPAALVLDGEATESLPGPAVALVKSQAAARGAAPSAEVQTAAAALLKSAMTSDELDPRDLGTFYRLAKGRPVPAEEVSELKDDALSALMLKRVPAPVVEPVVKSPPVQANPPAADPPQTVQKSKNFVFAEPERRLAYGWASVSTANGEVVEDFEGDTIDNNALHELAHHITRGTRAGDFEHDGVHCNEIVECIVMDKALQKALGIDLGREGVLIGTHIPGDEEWAKAQNGDWEHSIEAEATVVERA